MTLHSNRCCCHDAFPKTQLFLVFPSPLFHQRRQLLSFLLQLSLTEVQIIIKLSFSQPGTKHRISRKDKNCALFMSVLLRKNLSIISAGADPGSTSQGCPPLVTWFLSRGEKVAVPCWALERHTTLCVLWRLISCFPWLWSTALRSHCALGRAVLGRTLNYLMALWRMAASCSGTAPRARQRCCRAGSGLAVLLLPLRSAACPSHTPLTFTQTFYSFFLSFPMIKCLFSPPFKHCLTLLYKLLLKPIWQRIWNLCYIWGRWRDWNRMVNRQLEKMSFTLPADTSLPH